MRVSVRFPVLPLVVLVGLMGLVAWPATSHANEKVRTNANAKVYNRPGEQGKVVAKVKEGQAMTVVAKEGRWLKVRVSGRTGYIPRSKVDMPEGDDEIVRNTRRRAFVDGRGTKRGFGGEAGPDDRIGADATGDNAPSGDEGDGDEGDGGDDDDKGNKGGKKPPKVKKPPKGGGDDGEDEDPVASKGGKGSDEDEAEPTDDSEPEDNRVKASVRSKTVAFSEPSKDSDEAFKAKPDDVLFVESTKGKWTEVSVEDGDIGWILTSKLEMQDGGDGEGGGSRGGRMIDVRARLGFTLVSQTLTSGGGTTKWPDKYTVGSSSVAIALGGALLYPYKARYLVGGELTYDIAKAVPGVAFDPDGNAGPMPSSTTGFTIHNVNVRGVFGYDLKKKSGAVLFGRLGYHYEAFRVDNVTDLTKNSARLPQENISGPMLGVALAIPMLTNKLGLRINFDTILIGGSLTQTKNLEDGANPAVKKIVIGAGMTYRWKPGIDLSGGYDLNYASLSFGAPVANSMRMHTGTSVARTDLNHTISIGIAKAF
ncbi:MAG: SH3 domain-containing protein [Myxococcales bacterium]|nr:SH3 domain-containing protein [Myxococcales bacterium]